MVFSDVKPPAKLLYIIALLLTEVIRFWRNNHPTAIILAVSILFQQQSRQTHGNIYTRNPIALSNIDVMFQPCSYQHQFEMIRSNMFSFPAFLTSGFLSLRAPTVLLWLLHLTFVKLIVCFGMSGPWFLARDNSSVTLSRLNADHIPNVCVVVESSSLRFCEVIVLDPVFLRLLSSNYFNYARLAVSRAQPFRT